MGERRVALSAREIVIANLPDHGTATVEMEALIAEIIRIWMDREALTPRHTARKRLVVTEVYKLLPRTNCKLCGQASCIAFAGQLTVGALGVELCSPLCGEPQYTPQREALLAMIAEAG
jgi:ArsR family metal-binding transcriptional regulator